MLKYASTSLCILALSFFVATPLMAEVTYDPETGGFVGKGDVQAVFGWNNAQLQANADLLQFRYSEDIIVEGGACINPQTNAAHPNDVWQSTTGLAAAVAFDARTRKQITGFFVGDAGSGSTVFTDSCGGNRVPAPGSIISVIPGQNLEVSIDGVDWYQL